MNDWDQIGGHPQGVASQLAGIKMRIKRIKETVQLGEELGENDKTGFRHIDINIRRYVESGAGRNIIQGSVSMDDEVVSDCTELLLGMHKRIHEWWKVLQSRQEAGLVLKDGPVHTADKQMWTSDDERQSGLKFVAQPCLRGDVRISRPELPHGAMPAKHVRRTVLPWYVGVQADHQSLDIAGAGTWEQLSAAHRDLVPGFEVLNEDQPCMGPYTSSMHQIL